MAETLSGPARCWIPCRRDECGRIDTLFALGLLESRMRNFDAAEKVAPSRPSESQP